MSPKSKVKKTKVVKNKAILVGVTKQMAEPRMSESAQQATDKQKKRMDRNTNPKNADSLKRSNNPRSIFLAKSSRPAA